MADARKALAAGGEAAAVAPLTAGLNALREVRSSLASLNLPEPARFEIDFRLAQKEPQFAQALLLASRRADRRRVARRARGRGPATGGRPDGGQPRPRQRRGEHHREWFRRTGRGVRQHIAAGAGLVAQLQQDADGAGRRQTDGRALPQWPAGGAIRVRRGRAVRPAVPTDAVHGDVRRVREQHAVHVDAANPGAVGRRHLQR